MDSDCNDMAESCRHQYHEVVASDCYRLKSIGWTPTVVLDIGACVGMFIMAARRIWPTVPIVAVEPNAENFRVLTEDCSSLEGVKLIHAAAGEGPVYESLGADIGHHSYVAAGIGYSEDDLQRGLAEGKWTASDVESISLAELMANAREVNGGIVKFDCEGGDCYLFGKPEVTELLSQFRAVLGEVHFYAAFAKDHHAVRSRKLLWLHELATTHVVDCHVWENGMNVWAYRRQP